MKLTIENYKEFVPEKNQNLFYSLLLDLEELNNTLKNAGQNYRALYIDIQTEHNEYSPERVDPCPDYYGMYRLYCENDPYNSIGIEMDIDTLDTVLCTLVNFSETELS